MTSPTPMLAEPTAIPEAQAKPAREVSSPQYRASRAGTSTRTPGGAPTLPGVRSILIGYDRAKAADLLERVALLHLNEQIDDLIAWVVVRAVTPSGSYSQRWARFEELRAAVRLRDGINDGNVQWDEINDELTGPDRSEAAHDIACGHVDDAIRALLGSGR